MLARVGVSHIDDLFADIPAAMRPKSFSLPPGLPEHDVMERLGEMAARVAGGLISFLGAGAYDHAVSPVVDAISSRGEFATAYTPYQPEAAQGTLQAIFEYQTAVCRLLEMDAANASVYDGGSAVFEAAMMGVRAARRSRIIVDETLHPLYRTMLATLSANLPVRIDTVPHTGGAADMAALEAAFGDDAAAIVVQNPGFFGTVRDFTPLFAAARARGIKSVIAVNPVMQSVLKTPGEMGADIAVAEGQSIGMPLSFGGPYLGIMACARDMVRQLPGRIAGRTEDLDGKTGYVLTLQAREQHIRRAKATSNICSNQALCALRAVIHLSLLGPQGLARAAALSMQRAREAAAALTALPGVGLFSAAPFAHEFAVTLPRPAGAVARALCAQGVVPGLPLGRWFAGCDRVLLVACTEKTRPAHIFRLAESMGRVLAQG
jgi:glycine dehydrogenase subunit 1